MSILVTAITGLFLGSSLDNQYMTLLSFYILEEEGAGGRESQQAEQKRRER